MIKYLVMDVDGTLTDGKIYMGNDGEMVKAFDIKDGCGIHDILIPAGITPVIWSPEFEVRKIITLNSVFIYYFSKVYIHMHMCLL